jgi:hypothetical protein
MSCKETTVKRNRILLESAEKNLEFTEVAKVLTSESLKPISEKQWSLWIRYYAPLTANNPLYREELIHNNRSLAWFMRNLLDRHTKTALS